MNPVKSIDPLFFHEYDIDKYNCVHFLCDAWKHITGEDLAARMSGWLCAVSEKRFLKEQVRQFERLAQPVSPCIVLFQAPGESPHVGLFYRGKVLHIEQTGVQYMPLNVVAFGFNRVRFYK